MARYKRSKISLNEEENIAIGCITNDKFCKNFKVLIEDDLELLRSKYLRIIIGWSLDYFTKFQKAPNESIMDIYVAERENIQNEEDVEFIENSLENINSKYIEDKQKFDYDYIYGQVELYIRSRSLEINSDKIKGLLSQNKVLEAEKCHSDFKRKETGDIIGINLLKNMDAVDDMFIEEQSLFRMPGALGELMGEVYKGDLCYVGGPSKASKTWTAMELAMTCVQSGLNVMWVSLEMSARLMDRRFAQRIAGGSFKDIPKKIYVPHFDKNGNIEYSKEKVKQLTANSVKRKYKMFQRQCNDGKLVVYDATTSGNTVTAIKNSIITAKEFDGIDYDVVFIDQLNLLKTFGIKEKRLQLDSIALDIKREIAQDLNKLVFSPVQYNREALKKNTNDESSISESYSIFTHSSLLLSLNQTTEEKERGLMRITCSGRHSNYSGTCVVLQCLDLGRAIMDSRWIKDIPNYNDIITTSGYDEEDLNDLENA